MKDGGLAPVPERYEEAVVHGMSVSDEGRTHSILHSPTSFEFTPPDIILIYIIHRLIKPYTTPHLSTMKDSVYCYEV